MGLAVGNGQYRKTTSFVGITSTTDETFGLFANFVARKFIVSFKGNSKYRVLEMIAHRTGVTINDAIYSRVGDLINVDAQVLVVGSDVVLRMTNNESFALDVVIQTIKL